ncbi:MAG: hypothetical protein M5U34_29440 [Chloroflexi bacterium]|nr:hypothetical protein [Chloroflexota bacterium]
MPLPTNGVPATFTPPLETAVPTDPPPFIRDTATPSTTPLPIPTLTPFFPALPSHPPPPPRP